MFKNDKENEINTGIVLYTNAGKELFNICGAIENQEFFKYSYEKISKQVKNIEVVI